MAITFHRNNYCQVYHTDGQWYWGTVQSPPLPGHNGIVSYYVHLHHPLNRHITVPVTFMRPEPDAYDDNDQGSSTINLNLGRGQSLTMRATQLRDFGNQFTRQFVNNQSGVPQGGSSGHVAPPTPAPQPVVPSKRPREREQQATASAPSAHAVKPAVPNANSSATAPEPTTKRRALSSSNTPAADNAGQVDNSGSQSFKAPASALLEGPAVEVKVSMEAFEKSWHLPRALLSHVSPYFRAAIQDSSGASDTASIKLEDFNPTSFATFVQWMYYGTYNPQWEVPGPPVGDHHIDVWILGDKVEVPAFQDLAMSQIFSQYESRHRPLTTSTVLRVCAKTAANAPLRLLFLDILAQNFTDQYRVQGTLEEWDVALQEHPDARLALLSSLRAQGPRVKSKKDYLAANGRSSTGRETRSTTAFEAGRLQPNLSALPKIKSEIKKEPEES